MFTKFYLCFLKTLLKDLFLSHRYTATLHPFSSLHRWLCSHTRILLGLTWFFSSIYASIPILHTTVRPFEFNNSTYYECSYDNNNFDHLKRKAFMISNFVLTFLLPLAILAFSYTAIMLKLIGDKRNAQKVTGSSLDGGEFSQNALRKSTPVNHRAKV